MLEHAGPIKEAELDDFEPAFVPTSPLRLLEIISQARAIIAERARPTGKPVRPEIVDYADQLMREVVNMDTSAAVSYDDVRRIVSAEGGADDIFMVINAATHTEVALLDDPAAPVQAKAMMIFDGVVDGILEAAYNQSIEVKTMLPQ